MADRNRTDAGAIVSPLLLTDLALLSRPGAAEPKIWGALEAILKLIAPKWSIGAAFPANPIEGQIHVFDADVAAGLVWQDAAGAALAAAGAGDVARYAGLAWVRVGALPGWPRKRSIAGQWTQQLLANFRLPTQVAVLKADGTDLDTGAGDWSEIASLRIQRRGGAVGTDPGSAPVDPTVDLAAVLDRVVAGDAGTLELWVSANQKATFAIGDATRAADVYTLPVAGWVSRTGQKYPGTAGNVRVTATVNADQVRATDVLPRGRVSVGSLEDVAATAGGAILASGLEADDIVRISFAELAGASRKAAVIELRHGDIGDAENRATVVHTDFGSGLLVWRAGQRLRCKRQGGNADNVARVWRVG